MSDYEYYRDFGMNILWRWDGKIIESYSKMPGTEGGTWSDASELWEDPEDLNRGYRGSQFEAVLVDAEGNRL